MCMSRDMEDQRERIRGRRHSELTNRNAETISRTQLHYGRSRSRSRSPSSWRESRNREDRETSVAHQRHQRQLVEQRSRSPSSWRESRNREDRETSVAHQRHQGQLVEQQQQRLAIETARNREYGRARAIFRRAMNEMKQTVEIADGSGDFRSLMVAFYGEGVMRSWKYARAVFEDATGLQLKKETEDDEDDNSKI